MSAPIPHHDVAGLDLIQRDIGREATTLTGAIPQLRAAVEEVVGAVRVAPSRVYLIGCGDSLDDGIAARFAWGGMVPCAVEAVPAMTFATSVVDTAPEGALVVALSQSGKVSRVVEGVRSARARGLATIAVTADPDSPLAHEPADATWVIPFEKVGSVPGTTSFVLGAAALYEIGCALTGDPMARGRLRADLDQLGALIGEALTTCDPLADEHARAMSRELPVITLGYGPMLASARFTVRKLLELTQLVALSQETEEYAHDEYSLVGPDFRAIQFCADDRGVTRNEEVARYLRRLGVHLAIVVETPEVERFAGPADLVYPIPPGPPSLAPLLASVPGQLLSLAAARRVGGSLYGMAEQVHREDGDPQIYESEMIA
jgi:glutamine---fructose-6-phosphate transaminase (isomerizing)